MGQLYRLRRRAFPSDFFPPLTLASFAARSISRRSRAATHWWNSLSVKTARFVWDRFRRRISV